MLQTVCADPIPDALLYTTIVYMYPHQMLKRSNAANQPKKPTKESEEV